MSGTRPVKKGSFGGHFDELVTLFPKERKSSADTPDTPRRGNNHNVHDRLFEGAWNKH